MALRQTDELVKALQEAADRTASDIHMIPGEPVSFRVGGKIERGTGAPLTASQVRDIALAAVGEAALDRIGPATGDAQTSCGIPGVMDGRLAVARSIGEYTITVAVRIRTILTSKDAGIPEPVLKAAEAPHGLMIFAGRAGSGKMSAAYAMLNHFNETKQWHICTVEDPIAAFLTPKLSVIQQREVGSDIPSMLAGIRAAMQQDSDVLYVGDLPSEDEIDAAMAACESGHIVVAVVTGISPQDVIQRLVDVHTEETRAVFRRALSRELLSVTVQTLMPKATGKGRHAAYGYLVPNAEVRAAIRDGRDISAMPMPAGCLSLTDAIRKSAAEGKVAPEAAEAALNAM